MHEAFGGITPGSPAFAFLLAAMETLPRKRRAVFLGKMLRRFPEAQSAPAICSMSVTQRLRALPAPRDMLPAEKMAARAILSKCKACGRCERAL